MSPVYFFLIYHRFCCSCLSNLHVCLLGLLMSVFYHTSTLREIVITLLFTINTLQKYIDKCQWRKSVFPFHIINTINHKEQVNDTISDTTKLHFIIRSQQLLQFNNNNCCNNSGQRPVFYLVYNSMHLRSSKNYYRNDQNGIDICMGIYLHTLSMYTLIQYV